jgi:hypothetical protein
MRLSANVSLLTVEATVRDGTLTNVTRKKSCCEFAGTCQSTTVGGILDIFQRIETKLRIDTVLEPKVKAIRATCHARVRTLIFTDRRIVIKRMMRVSAATSSPVWPGCC